MEEIDAEEVVRAKAFWAAIDVNLAFNEVCEYLIYLRNAIKHNTATDREYIHGMNMITLLDSAPTSMRATTPVPSDAVVQVVIGADVSCPEMVPVSAPDADSPQTPLPPEQNEPTSPPSPPLLSNGSADSLLPPAAVHREDLMAPLVPLQPLYKPHDCTMACLPRLPKSSLHFWGQNPLTVPLHCKFQRLCAVTLLSEPGAGDSGGEGEDLMSLEEATERDVVYKTPCGLSLRCHGDVMRFLLATESYATLQMDYFTFNPAVRLDPPRLALPRAPERDLSRGAEPTPVELCLGEDGAKPEDFRYRKDRWPHGCFLSRGPMLFKSCCDCVEGCVDAESCACIRLTTGGHQYSNQRLYKPVPAGLYECGPWCGCDRTRCQNRVVQRGLRVRLQVFQTKNKGWGVRCRDDIDQGTFICTFAGLVLRTGQGPDDPSPPKRQRAELSSDDEVELVTEWLAPPLTELGRRALLETLEPSPPTSPPQHIRVIQRPADAPQIIQERGERVQKVVVGSQEPDVSPDTGEHAKAFKRTALNSEPVIKEVSTNDDDAETSPKNLKRIGTEDTCYLDATKEGNVGRFINHSCEPNLFVQNIFTDSHDPSFPMIAFFTSTVVRAGTELTWNYSHDPGSPPELEVPCHCGSDQCRGLLNSDKNICEICEVEVPDAAGTEMILL